MQSDLQTPIIRTMYLLFRFAIRRASLMRSSWKKKVLKELKTKMDVIWHLYNKIYNMLSVSHISMRLK